jgi:hypothetical protein
MDREYSISEDRRLSVGGEGEKHLNGADRIKRSMKIIMKTIFRYWRA